MLLCLNLKANDDVEKYKFALLWGEAQLFTSMSITMYILDMKHKAKKEREDVIFIGDQEDDWDINMYRYCIVMKAEHFYFLPLLYASSLFFMNYFNTFQNYNFLTIQICFVTPVWATLHWKSSKTD